MMVLRALGLSVLFGGLLLAQSDTRRLLEHPVLSPIQPLLEVQVYTGAKVPTLRSYNKPGEWDEFASQLRTRILDEVVYRGVAKEWRTAKTKVEILEPFATGPGYRVRQFKYEIIPGFWVPGLIYEPEKRSAAMPVVLNVNGHEGNGTQTPYIQTRCINLVKKGFIAVNPEWLGMGQLKVEGMNHYRMPQIDLTGTSGLALFHLALKRGLDVALSLPGADQHRVAVTGLSGGGWQTIFLSSLDTRVGAAMPVAGYSSYVTRAQWPELDLGDSEQTPSDLASVADYTHLTAMMSPRPLNLTYNSKDSCCFRADYAVSPLLHSAMPIFTLSGVPMNLKYHVNYGDGHNYDRDNRESLYRFLKSAFRMDFNTTEEVVEDQIRQQDQIRPALPADNLDFHRVAVKLAASLPRAGSPTVEDLRRVTRYKRLTAEGVSNGEEGGAEFWKLSVGQAWTVPATSFGAGEQAVIVIGDEGRAALAADVDELKTAGKRVLALDPFYMGESKIAKRDFLFAMLLAGLGERPLGLQAAQLNAVARWLKSQKVKTVEIRARGPRTSLMALVAAAVEPDAVSGLDLRGSFQSLREILERDIRVDPAPELFCFGLLERFDVPQIATLVKPRAVAMNGR